MSLTALLGSLVCPLLMAGVIATFTYGPVSRARLERFARRQRLPVTADNGNQVIRYLATTRRWRTTGFVGGLVVSVLGSTVSGQGGRADFAPLFVGWFLGALVAEVRVAHLEHGPLPAASLQPRRPNRYLGRFSWALVPATAGLAVAVGAATAVGDGAGWAHFDGRGVLWLGLALAVAAAVRAIQLAVVRRPQPLAPPDVLAADDAIRSRSLHVLAGGGAALVLLCVGVQLTSIEGDVVGIVRGLGVLLVAALGWNVATSIWPPSRPPGLA